MRGTRWHLALALLVAIASAACFLATRHAVQRAADERTSTRAEAAAAQLLDRVNLASSYVESVRRFMVGRGIVTQDAFAAFAHDALGSSGVVDVAWVQPVTAAERTWYERTHGVPILELRPAGLQEAPRRDRYLPAPLIRASHSSETVPSRDLSIHPELRDAVARPEARYGVTASAPATYQQQPGLWFVEATPRITADGIVPGYVVAFVPGRFLETSLRGEAAEATLHVGATPPAATGAATSTFGAAAQRWHVSVPPAAPTGAARALPWIIGTGGGLVALLILALGGGEAARRAARDELDRMFMLSRDLIGTANLESYFTRVNPAFERTLGYSTEELLSRPFLDFVHPDDRAATIAEASRLSAGGETVAFENRYRCKDGSYRWLEWKAVGVLERGEIYFVARDITERRAAEQERERLEGELRQSQKLEAIGRLAGGMAHDFNNVLTVVTGYSDLVLHQLPVADPMRADIEEIRRATDQARSLTQRLLQFSRRGLPEAETTDPNDAVVTMDRLLQRLLGADIELVTELTPGLGHVPVDRGQLEQIVVNLALNARDAMPHGGRLVLRTSRTRLGASEPYSARGLTPLAAGAYVVLAVHDDGVGMDAETRARAVEPFFTTKGPGHGTGLGLSTVWGTVEHAGGRVVLDSEAGQGSTVTLYLPELGVAEGAEQVSRAAAAPSTLNTTVLVVDDDADVRTLTARLLVEAGHRVEQAADAASALAVWARRRELIGALVTDVVMPGSNGVELVERLLHERADLAVVVVSGYPGDAIPQRLDGHDVVFLAKPFAADALLSALHQAQEASRRRASGVTRLA